MAGDTIIFRRGSSFEFQGQFKDPAGVPISLEGIEPDIYETHGSGMQDATISVTDEALGKFLIYLPVEEANKLPLGKNSWFKIRFDYEGSESAVVFPPVWVDAR
jgi:hypothetical protein